MRSLARLLYTFEAFEHGMFVAKLPLLADLKDLI